MTIHIADNLMLSVITLSILLTALCSKGSTLRIGILSSGLILVTIVAMIRLHLLGL